MNRKSVATSLFITIISCPVANAMFTRSARGARQQALRSQAMRQQTQRRLIQTHQQTASVKEIPSNINTIDTTTEKKAPLTTANTGIWSYWTAFKNKIFRASTTPIAATVIPATPVPVSAAPTIPQKLILRIDALKTLPQAKELLSHLTQDELNAMQTHAHIPEKLWSNLIDEIQETLNYIQQQCLVQEHDNASWDADIPAEINTMLLAAFAAEQIHPKSTSVHYRDTVDVDPFGHDTISVVGPTITYQMDSLGKNIITGYEPGTITLHKQNIAKLTQSQFEAKLQHSITHLKQAHTEQITLLKNTLGKEKYNEYAQPYKQALEREADFLQPIQSAQVAHVVQQAFLDEAFDAALKEVKVNREKHELDNKETSLITVCAPPGDGPQ